MEYTEEQVACIKRNMREHGITDLVEIGKQHLKKAEQSIIEKR